MILRLLHCQLLSIGHAHLNFACFDIIFHFLPSLILFVCINIFSLVWCLVLEIALLCCEVDKFLTQVNLLVEWILFKFLELSKFPFTLPFLLFFPSLLLIKLDFLFFSLLLLKILFFVLCSLAPLSIVLGLSLFAFHDSLFGLSYPLNVFKETLLNLIVAHLAIESLLGIIHLFP